MRSSCSVNYVVIENRLFMLGVVFLFSQFSPIETTIFDKIFLYPIDDINFLSSDEKSSPPIIFWDSSGGLQTANLAKFWTIFCAL